MESADFLTIIKYAWMEYDPSRKVKTITDISAMVSTNHVYKIDLADKRFIIAKLSHFGTYDGFVEDHTIINVLSNNLPYPYENVLSRSLMKANEIFIHRFTNSEIDAAVVFYRPVKIRQRPPKRFNDEEIIKLGKEIGKFHKACHTVRHTLPPDSKSLKLDIEMIKEYISKPRVKQYSPADKELISKHCEIFKEEAIRLDLPKKDLIPVFIDWNIGNFSVSSSFKLYSRWDYDWFRISTRVLDFYFLSRVVSDRGDRTMFTYNSSTLTEDRFKLFLEAYHKVFPLSRNEIFMIKEAYRFFLLNYVIRHGSYFFNEKYAQQLRRDAIDIHLPSLEALDMTELAEYLNL